MAVAELKIGGVYYIENENNKEYTLIAVDGETAWVKHGIVYRTVKKSRLERPVPFKKGDEVYICGTPSIGEVLSVHGEFVWVDRKALGSPVTYYDSQLMKVSR